MQELENLARNYLVIFQKFHRVQNIYCMLANRDVNVSFSTNAAWAIIEFHRNNVYWHFEQVCKNQISELKVKVDKCSSKLFQVPLFVISVKNQW